MSKILSRILLSTESDLKLIPKLYYLGSISVSKIVDILVYLLRTFLLFWVLGKNEKEKEQNIWRTCLTIKKSESMPTEVISFTCIMIIVSEIVFFCR